MSGKKSKLNRQDARNTAPHLVNAAIVQRTAGAVLAMDTSDVVLHDFVPQVAVGLAAVTP